MNTNRPSPVARPARVEKPIPPHRRSLPRLLAHTPLPMPAAALPVRGGRPLEPALGPSSGETGALWSAWRHGFPEAPFTPRN